MSFIKYNFLSKIAGVGAVGVIGLGLYSCYRMANIHSDSSYFKDAMATVKEHAGVKQFLGSPLSAGYVEIQPSDEASSVAEFKTRLKGQKASGVMHFWVERKMGNEGVVFDVNRIEVEIAGDKTKRLVVKSQ